MTDQDREAQNDYLWDGTGVPDEAIVRLENTLCASRLARGCRRENPVTRPRAWITGRWLAAAAALVLIAGGAWLALCSAAAPGR